MLPVSPFSNILNLFVLNLCSLSFSKNTATALTMPRERKPSAKVREMQALEEEHGSNFDSLLQQEMINEALAMYQQEKASNDDDKDDGHGDEDVAMIEDARFLLEQTFKEEDEAMEEDDEKAQETCWHVSRALER
jgi:hypothetical protein